AVLGHSQGEIAAAYVCGALSLKDAAKTVALRSRALAAVRGRGGMASLPLPVQEVEQLISERWADRLWVAAVNGPHSTTVSGDAEAVDEVLAHCAGTGVRARRIPVDYASHCPHVQPLHDELLHLLGDISPQPSAVPFFSTVEGTWLETASLDAAYWYRNLHQPVRFSHAVQALADDGHRVFVEVSPHPTLVPAIEDTAQDVTAIGSLRRGDNDTRRFLTALAHAHTTGIGVPTTWRNHYTQPHHQPHNPHLDLPTYPFQHQHYWLDAPTGTGDVAAAGLESAEHPLLAATVQLADTDGCLLTGRLSLRSHPWLGDYEVGGVVLLSGSAFVELAVQVGERVGCTRIEQLTVHAPLVVPAGGSVSVQVGVAAADGSGRRLVSVYARGGSAGGGGGVSGGVWTCHASGVLVEACAGGGVVVDGLAGVWPPRGAVAVDVGGVRDRLAEAGCVLGPVFSGLRAVWRDGEDLLAEVCLPEVAWGDAAGFGLHPALLDGVVQPLSVLLVGGAGLREGVRVPAVWGGVSLHRAGVTGVRVRVSAAGRDGGRGGDGGRGEAVSVSVAVGDEAGVPVASVDCLELRPVDMDQLRAVSVSAGRRGSLYAVQWADVGSVPASGQAWAWYEDISESSSGPVPGVVVLRCPDAGSGVGEVVGGVLGVVQGWLA
ncbi:acyltransferase domain-containing protein, partial [Streptomyces avermitilis]|uniref:acyltransferase domain-containing protein n=1 Tax=Streptomyces avermitilis TaxID=33903 RepID=UPI0033BA94DB